ncbi:MAG: aspartate kinase [Clostridia bacterium]|nr:aspartate kinase [Clostridia bacterium]
MIKVCKFGGTSMANANALKQVKDIVLGDKDRRYIVVSAPGKRFKEDIKITDTLYKCYNELVSGGDFKGTFNLIKDRFIEMVKELNLTIDIKSILEQTEKEIIENKSPDFTASRGEYLSARVMAEFLGAEFVDAADMIRFDSRGKLNEDYTDDKVASRLASVQFAVIPGFYGKDSKGNVKTFSRGGSDVTGSIIASGVEADLYENWTDVSGFLTCDPRIVENSKVIKELTYKELRELSYMGAAVLHSEAIFPVMKKKISINIKNTFKPTDAGTMIVPSEAYTGTDNVITGIAGKKDFTVIFIEKNLMNAEVGFIRKVLSVVEKHNICVEHAPSGIDTLSIVLESAQLKGEVLFDIINEIRESVNPDFVHVIENISLIAIVGHGMARRAGTAAKIFTALAKAGVNIKMIDQGSSELNIIVGVSNEDYEKCISAIYNEFMC